MGFIDWLEDDDLFLIKYGLIIGNFMTIIVLIYFRRVHTDPQIKNVLLLTAHPDDEAMFFIPTIQYLKQNQYHIHLLCLTNGNADKLGTIREAELEKCCKYLQIQKVTCLNDNAIQDGMNLQWPITQIKDIISKYVEQHEIKGIITFDDYGISGHTNHISCYSAAIQLKSEELKIFVLKSTNIIRKYISILDFFISALSQDHLFINLNVVTAWKAMQIHRSQFVWYRKLFIVFSRYAYINTLQQI